MRWTEATPKQRHRPPHFLTGRHAFFITASTVDRKPYMLETARREALIRLLHAWGERCGITVSAWVVLKEHYHAVVVPADEREPELKRWIAGVHGESSHQWNEEDRRPGRQVWYEYWDRTLWTDGDLWSRINYVHYNPVKHGYADDPDAYPWSSLHDPERDWGAAEVQSHLARFVAPRKIPNDDF